MHPHPQIKTFLSSLSPDKRAEMEILHERFLQLMPNGKLWFLDGKDEQGKVLTNPQIGYGQQTLHYAKGRTREFYQFGLSANASGISVYILGLKDKTFLPEKYGSTIGKASVTGYCIKFKSLKNVEIEVLINAVQDGIRETSPEKNA